MIALQPYCLNFRPFLAFFIVGVHTKVYYLKKMHIFSYEMYCMSLNYFFKVVYFGDPAKAVIILTVNA